MNIFILDSSLSESVKAHVDKHVVKMPTEAAQMLFTLCHEYNLPALMKPLSAGHAKHPCMIWLRQSKSNFLYLRDYCIALGYEHSFRYRNSSTLFHLAAIKVTSISIPSYPDIGLTPFAQALPSSLKSPDPISSYRSYYNRDKKHLHSWKNRPTPTWIKSC